MGINEIESERFSHQRRRMSQWSCWLWVAYMFPEFRIFLLDESLRSFNLNEKNNALIIQNYFPEFKVSRFEVSYPRPTMLMFCWNVNHSTWVRFYACVVWIVNSYVTKPTCWSLPYLLVYFNRDTHYWPHKEYAYKNFRHTKLLSEPPTRKRRPWNEATNTPARPCLTFRCVCTRSQGWVVVENSPTPQQHCRVAVWPLVVENINSTNIIFTGKKMGKKNRFWPFFCQVTWLTPPPSTPNGGFSSWDVILGGSPFELTGQVGLTSCHLSSDLKSGRRRGWQVNLTSATCQVTCRVPLVPKTQVQDPDLLS